MSMRSVVAVFALIAAGACGDSSSTSPSVNVSGNWSGTVTSTAVGVTATGSLHASLVQSGGSLSGTWSTTNPDGSLNDSGNATGTVTGSQIDLILSPSNPTLCPDHAIGIVSGSTITGTSSAFNCSIAVSSSFALTKQ